MGRGDTTAGWQSDLARDVERPRNNSRTVRFYYPFENSHRFTSLYELSEIAGLRRLTFTGFLGAYEQRTDQDRFPTATAGRSIERAEMSLAKDFHLKASGERLAGFRAPRVRRRRERPYGSLGPRRDSGIQPRRRVDARHRQRCRWSRRDASTRASTRRLSRDSARAPPSRQGCAPIRVDHDEHRRLFRRPIHGQRRGVGVRRPHGGAVRRLQRHGPGVAGLPGSRAVGTVYFRGPSGRGFITGNPYLSPESSLQFDLAARYAAGQCGTQAAVYAIPVSDLRFWSNGIKQRRDLLLLPEPRARAPARCRAGSAGAALGRDYTIAFCAEAARGRALDDGGHLDDVSPPAVSILVRKDSSAGHWGRRRGLPGLPTTRDQGPAKLRRRARRSSMLGPGGA